MFNILDILGTLGNPVVKPPELGTPVDWRQNIGWKPLLHIAAKSYPTYSVFDVKPTREMYPEGSEKAGEAVVSKCECWLYRERILEKDSMLRTYSGSRIGTVCFDDEVVIPMLHHKRANGRWHEHPWMSFTPMEYLTLRPGLRKARGHTVIAGLGLGYQLQKVCAKKNVKKVTLVEQSESLISWVLPRLDLGETPVETIQGDAYDIVPTLDADVALIDIYPGYGRNTFRHCPNIRDVWVWGAAKVSE